MTVRGRRCVPVPYHEPYKEGVHTTFITHNAQRRHTDTLGLRAAGRAKTACDILAARKAKAILMLHFAAISPLKCTPARVFVIKPGAFTHPRVMHLGTTTLAVQVDAQGRVQRISVIHPSVSRLLDRSFVNAAQRSTYAPMHCGGRNEPSRIIISHDWDSS